MTRLQALDPKVATGRSKELFDGPYQYAVDHEFKKIALSTLGESDPNSTSARIGLIYPGVVLVL